MRITLLHYTSWPEIGGVETMIRDQARLLTQKGHEVTLLTGAGEADAAAMAGTFVRLPELAFDFPLNAAARTHLERGQADQNFTKYRAVLSEALTPRLKNADLTLVHNVFTMHFNLALTQTLHDLASQFRFVAWTHDLTATNSDYALPNPTKQPWALVRQSVPGVRYVAVSPQRAEEIKAHLQPAPEVTVIPDGIDLSRFLLTTPEIGGLVSNLRVTERDFVLLLPARLSLRKNIEFAIETAKTLLEKGRDPLVLITGAPDPFSAAAAQYGQFLKFSLPENLKNHVAFIHDLFPVTDAVMKDLYLISDCLLYPSKQEGFGLPLLEAALHRLPAWCTRVPAYDTLNTEGCYLVDDPRKLDAAIAWLESQPTFRARRHVARQLTMAALYDKYYAPLLAT